LVNRLCSGSGDKKGRPIPTSFSAAVRQDSDSGQTGACIAEILGLAPVTVAKKIEAMDGKVKIEKVTADGYEVVEVPTPALITVSNELAKCVTPPSRDDGFQA